MRGLSRSQGYFVRDILPMYKFYGGVKSSATFEMRAGTRLYTR
jgi:hypothetical protein